MFSRYVKIYFSFLLIFASPAYSQTRPLNCASKQIEHLYVTLINSAASFSSTVIDDSLSNAQINRVFPVTYKGKEIYVRMLLDIKHNIIEDIGVKIFNKNEFYDFYPFTSFLESLIMSFVLLPKEEIEQIWKYNKIELLLNGETVSINEKQRYSESMNIILTSKHITLDKGNIFAAKWKSLNNQSVILKTPTNINTLLGKDKKELEELYIRQVSQWNKRKERILLSPKETNYVQRKDSIITVETKEFMNYSSSMFYKKVSPDNFILLKDDKYPKESISNILQTASNYFCKSVRIKMFLYGGKDTVVVATTENFISSTLNQDLFLGCERIGDSISVTALSVDPDLKYLHLIYFVMSTEQIFHLDEHVLDVVVYPYIRSDNIKELFQNSKTANKFNIKIDLLK